MALFLFSMHGVSLDDVKNKSGSVELSPTVTNDTDKLKEFTRAFLDYLNGTPKAFSTFYFSRVEAELFSKKLIYTNYPDVDNSVSAVILEKNNLVKNRIRHFLGEYNCIELIDLVFKEGYTADVNGYLLKYKLGNENGWNESFSIQLIRYKNTLKILSLKDYD